MFTAGNKSKCNNYRPIALLPQLSNRLFGGGVADVGNAAPTFCFSVPAILKLTSLTVESLWTAPTENVKHRILMIDKTS